MNVINGRGQVKRIDKRWTEERVENPAWKAIWAYGNVWVGVERDKEGRIKTFRVKLDEGRAFEIDVVE